jgi:hypothetical protein
VIRLPTAAARVLLHALLGLTLVVAAASAAAPASPATSATSSSRTSSDQGSSALSPWPEGTDLISFENLEGIVLVSATATMPAGFDTTGVWVFDTGAGYLALDGHMARRGGLAGEPPRAGETVGIAGRALPRLRMGTLSRDQVTPVLTIRADMVRDITDRPVLGLIGQQIVRDRILCVDYVRERMALVPAAQAPQGDADADDVAARVARSRAALGVALERAIGSRARPVPFELLGDGKVVVTATLRDASADKRSRPLTLIVDTGASKSVLFERTLDAAVEGHERWRSRGGLVAPTLIGPASARIVRLPVITLESPGADGRARRTVEVDQTDAVLTDSPLQEQLETVTGTAVHGLLGYSFLRRFRFALDYPNRILWLHAIAVGQDQRAHEHSHVGIQMERRDGRVEVVAVAQGSPADSAGVRAGDEVLAVDGRIIGQGALIDAARWLEGPPGSTVVVRTRRDGAVREVRMRRARLL